MKWFIFSPLGHEITMVCNSHKTESPATLVAIIVAARRGGDRELERQMKHELEDQFGVKLTFLRRPRQAAEAIT